MKPQRGMTIIDVIVGTALVLTIFLALFGLMRASLAVSAIVKDQATALAVANTQMEYVRSLSYDSVGTVGGIPSGSIPQTSTTTEDGMQYVVRTFVQYYDDPADGTGSSDTNGIIEDYKQIKVSVSYTISNQTRQIVLNSIYVPQGIETTVGGGTLQIDVVNASGSPVPGATVTITNASTTPTVNVTTFSDINGQVSLPGAATSTQYAVTVTKSGYSTAQTYARTTTNQNPTPGYLTVVGNQTTTGTFAIDALSTLTLRTYLPIATSTFSDTFADNSQIASSTNTSISGGDSLVLAGGSGNYVPQGTAISVAQSPTYLYSWGAVNATTTIPSGDSLLIQVVDGSGNVLPDSVVPGNSTGFTSFPVNLYAVSTTTYPSLALKAALQTSSTSTTPFVKSWSLSYQAGPTPLPNIPFTLTGAKTIGTTGAGAPIYKTTVSATTDSTGKNVQILEWDSYSLGISGYDVINACSAPSFAISPGAAVTEALTIGSSTPNSILATVSDSSTGQVVSGASVTVSDSGYNKTVTTSSCGTAYFGTVPAASDYSVTISKSGYTSHTATNVTVSGETYYADAF